MSADLRGVSPEDREEFFQACSRLLFSAHGDTADMSKIVKVSHDPPCLLLSLLPFKAHS